MSSLSMSSAVRRRLDPVSSQVVDILGLVGGSRYTLQKQPRQREATS